MNLTRALGSVGGLTLASRVLGLVRDSLFARFVGAGFASDAFLIAFRLPNMFRALFAEGAFSAVFVPMFNHKVAAKDGRGLPDGIRFAEDALSVLLPVLIVLLAILEVAAWPLTWALSGGFNDRGEADFAFAVMLSRFTLPYLLLISLVSLLGGILNSLNKFWVNAAAPILLNATLIAALLLFHDANPLLTARNQAIAVTVSGALQLAWLWWACRRAGISLKLRRPQISPDVKKLLKLIWPAAAGSSAVQINLVVSTALAATLLPAGSVSYIYFADRLNQLPLGLIGIGLGTVLLPTISRQLGGGDEAGAMATQNRGLELALLLTLPATVALIVCGVPIVAALFQGGRFTASDSLFTAQALAAFSIGLPSYILVKVLTPGFYARSDTRTPVRFATISMLVNLIGNLLLIPTIGHIGPPLATALASTVNVVLLYAGLRKRGHFAPDAQLKRRIPRAALAALLMGAAMWFGNALFQPYVTGTAVERWGAMLLLVTSGGLIYALAVLLTGAFRPAEVRQLLRRSPKA
ncbi:murein biosynthesis integral membrane protein MurJ [Sphingomonas sp.]|jgi:putative peptidoglycan lipid II flippase|uniref:murein biosynthesis integral membrane protein MurJ n=1 Tax=Sphingomonas sp. TaxID=28214 RepID=UPI002D7EEE29|nr:murein biosynthesis integral membrane protein MurJ [Sphingomonas sp.]HEU0044565.1 murein biosynthesis integral membrane protein MurJ [Sphingomonas sp.]